MMKIPATFFGVLVFAGILPAHATTMKLSELSDKNLAEKSLSLSDYMARKRRLMRASVSTDLLVKFKTAPKVRVLAVFPEDEQAAIALLNQRPDVEFAEKNRRLKRQFIPSDPLLGEQWQHDKIQSRRAWDLGTGSHSVRVAIVDFSFKMDHPDLAANTVSGWDVVNETPVFSGNDGHATFSAGMVAGVLDNGLGVAGMGNCTVLPIVVNGDISAMVAAIYWASAHNVRIVNMSWTGADDPAINQAAEFFRTESDGVVVMAGVNGSGFLDYTNQPYIVAVSMTDSADALQSKYGDHIDFSAPGLNVKSTTVSGYGVDSGTSFSTPLVSGLLAMLFSIDPTLTTEQALSVLRQTAVDLGDAGWDQKFGWGRVDFYQAAWLAAAHSAQPPVWSNAVERVSKSNLVVSAEFHPGVDYTLWGKDALESTNWFEVDAPTQTNDWNFEYQVDLTTVTQKFFKVTGEVSL